MIHQPFRVLGIDPGSLKTGWGVIEVIKGKLHFLGSGISKAKSGAPLAERLLTITTGIEDVINEAGQCDVAIEEVFVAKNVRSAVVLSHARGALMLTAAKYELPVYEYSTAVAKRTVAGSGRADKTQVARIVQAMLQLKELPGEDATDALAIAITHAQRKMSDRSSLLKK